MIAISHNGALRLATKLERAAKTELHRALVNSTERSARVVEKDLKDKRFAGNPIKMRSGLTRSSIRTQVDRGRDPGAAVGTPMKHVPGLETGITIRPTHSKYLTVPLKAALTPGGKSRGDARTVGALYDATFVLKRRGKLIIMGKKGNKVTPLFVLKKSVRIKARWAFRTSTEQTRTGVVRLYDQGVAQAIR